MRLFLAISVCLFVPSYGVPRIQRPRYQYVHTQSQPKVSNVANLVQHLYSAFGSPPEPQRSRYQYVNTQSRFQPQSSRKSQNLLESSEFSSIQGPSIFVQTEFGLFPLAIRNAMSLDERNTYLPVMKALIKVMDTNKPTPEDVNEVLVLSRDLAKKGLQAIPAFGGVKIANMGLLDEGDAIVYVDGIPHILTKHGAFPLSNLNLMTNEEKRTYLPITKTFTKVLEKDFIDQNDINTLIRQGEELQDRIPAGWREMIVEAIMNEITYDIDALGNFMSTRQNQLFYG